MTLPVRLTSAGLLMKVLLPTQLNAPVIWAVSKTGVTSLVLVAPLTTLAV
jgi:hypothetical protein